MKNLVITAAAVYLLYRLMKSFNTDKGPQNKPMFLEKSKLDMLAKKYAPIVSGRIKLATNITNAPQKCPAGSHLVTFPDGSYACAYNNQ